MGLPLVQSVFTLAGQRLNRSDQDRWTVLFREQALVGVLGGLRAPLANLVWVEGYVHWEQKNLGGVEKAIRLAVAVDPEPLFFWINGARIMAYDMPRWHLRQLRENGAIDPRLVEEVRAEHAQKALAFLSEAARWHRQEYTIYIEAGLISANLLHDKLRAADYFGKAGTMPGGPYYAARLRGEMLRQAGHPAEAYRWYRQLHAALPANDPATQRQTVLERLRALEEELSIPASERYVEP